MAPTFEWDEDKGKRNLRKHGVSFIEAIQAFYDPIATHVFDEAHSEPGEQRFVIVGSPRPDRLLVVVYCYRGKVVRLISVRKATRLERREYEKEAKDRS